MGYRDKAKQREYQLQWIKKRREEWIAANGPCVKCGSFLDLEVDHIDPSQKVDHKVWSWRRDRRDAELEKCQVLCNNCHKSKSAKQKFDRVRHGSFAMYNNHGCRCDSCVAVNSDKCREWKLRTGYRNDFQSVA